MSKTIKSIRNQRTLAHPSLTRVDGSYNTSESEDADSKKPNLGHVLLVTSGDIFKHANVKEAMNHLGVTAIKVPHIESEINNISARLGTSPADPSVVKGRHIFEVKLSHEGASTYHHFSLPFLVSKDGFILDAATLNKELIVKAAQYTISRTRDSIINKLQDHLIDTYLPVLKNDNISFVNFLPLLTNPESIKATAYVQVHSSIIESPLDLEDRLVSAIYDYVVHDDSAPVVVPLLDQKLLSSPKVAPLLHKLFSSGDSSGSVSGQAGSGRKQLVF